MLIPHPTTLGRILHTYESLRTAYAKEPTAQARQCMNDAAYTLCVTTGTRDVDTAVLIARRQLARHPAPAQAAPGPACPAQPA